MAETYNKVSQTAVAYWEEEDEDHFFCQVYHKRSNRASLDRMAFILNILGSSSHVNGRGKSRLLVLGTLL